MNIPDALADIDAVLATSSKEDHGAAGHARIVIERVTRYHACISRYAPPNSPYRIHADRYASMLIQKGAPRLPDGVGYDHVLQGVLQALRADVANGKLASFEEMVRADVYEDLIAQGASLLDEGFSRAAAVLVGAALEDHLRKLASKHQLQLNDAKGHPKRASELNADLRKAGVYAEVQRTSIEGWQKLRNEAAHGKPGFEGTDTTMIALVAPAIAGVRAFISQYPA